MDAPNATPSQPPKKKLPTWVKVVIVLSILFVGFSVVASIGLRMLAGVLTSKGGQMLAEKGVEKGIEKMIEKGIEQSGGGKASVDISKNGLVIKDEKTGQQLAITGNQQLPSGFPDDIPVYSGARAQGSMIMGPMTMVTLESEASVGDISSFYQSQLSAKGWTQAFSASPTPESSSSIYKKDNRQLTLTISGTGGKTSLILAYGQEQQ